MMLSFLAMNGYGFYIWTAYGVTAVVLAAELLALRSHRERALRDARVAAEAGVANPGSQP
jgi:heme exporter protein CcmD